MDTSAVISLTGAFIRTTGEVLAELKRQTIADLDLEMLRQKRELLAERLDDFNSRLKSTVEQMKSQAYQDLVSRGLANSSVRENSVRAIERDASLEIDKATREFNRAIEEIALLERRVREEANPWWRHFFQNVTHVLLYVYGFGILISVPYFNWSYARNQGFVNWLFLGEVIATAQAIVWPYYVISSAFQPKWTDSEKENLEHFHRSREAIQEVARILNSGDSTRPSIMRPEEVDAMLALHKIALKEARQVDLRVLAKAHPELPSNFREKYLLYLERVNQQHEAGNASFSDQRNVQLLLDDWIDWFNANNHNIRMPKRARL